MTFIEERREVNHVRKIFEMFHPLPSPAVNQVKSHTTSAAGIAMANHEFTHMHGAPSTSISTTGYTGRMLRGVSTSSSGSRLQNSFSVEVAQELKGPMTKVFLIWFVISCLIMISNKLFTFGANDAVFVGSLLSLIGTLLILFSATNSEDHERKVSPIDSIFSRTIS
jgi:hypothetical protein